MDEFGGPSGCSRACRRRGLSDLGPSRDRPSLKTIKEIKAGRPGLLWAAASTDRSRRHCPRCPGRRPVGHHQFIPSATTSRTPPWRPRAWPHSRASACGPSTPASTSTAWPPARQATGTYAPHHGAVGGHVIILEVRPDRRSLQDQPHLGHSFSKVSSRWLRMFRLRLEMPTAPAWRKSEQRLISLQNQRACHAEGRGFEPRRSRQSHQAFSSPSRVAIRLADRTRFNFSTLSLRGFRRARKLTRPRARLVPHQPSAQPSQFLIPCGQGLRLGKPKMDEWKGITSHDALQRFLVLILLCLVILLLIAAAVWYIA